MFSHTQFPSTSSFNGKSVSLQNPLEASKNCENCDANLKDISLSCTFSQKSFSPWYFADFFPSINYVISLLVLIFALYLNFNSISMAFFHHFLWNAFFTNNCMLQKKEKVRAVMQIDLLWLYDLIIGCTCWFIVGI